MNKIKIDNFLKYIAQIIKENPNLSLETPPDVDFIYSELVRISIPLEIRKNSIRDIFDKWIEYYKDVDNINVFTGSYWKNFCQFINKDFENTYEIKIYIPTKQEYIEKNAKIIFNYLANNDIHHESKIHTSSRFDNIVVRLYRTSDAINFLNYIEGINDIKEGLIEANPFAFTHNNIALAYDGDNSYNATIACYIRMYMKEKREKNELDNVSCEDFAIFIKKFYQKSFIDKENIRDIGENFHYIHENEYYNGIFDIKNITGLFIKAYDGMDLTDYFNMFNNINNKNNKQKEIEFLKDNEFERNRQKQLLQANKELLTIYSKLRKSYNNEEAIEILTSYLSTNNASFLPDDVIVNSNVRNIIYNYIIEEDLTIYDYLENIVIEYIFTDKKEAYNEVKIWQLIESYLMVGKIKYGKENAINNLVRFLILGQYNYITRDNDLRKEFMNNNVYEELKKLLDSYNISLLDYYNFFNRFYEIKIEKEDNKSL